MTCLRSLKLYLKTNNVRVYVGVCKWRGVKAEKEKETLRQAYVHRTRAIVEQFSLILKQICVSVKVNGATEGYIIKHYASIQGSR